MSKILSITVDYGEIPLDENGFVDWLIDAQVGAGAAYYRGSLAHDRCESTKVQHVPPPAPKAEPLGEVLF